MLLFLEFIWESSCSHYISEKLCKPLNECAAVDRELIMDTVNAQCLSTLEIFQDFGNLISTEIPWQLAVFRAGTFQNLEFYFYPHGKSLILGTLNRDTVRQLLGWMSSQDFLSAQVDLHLVFFSAGFSCWSAWNPILQLLWSIFVCMQQQVHGVVHLLFLSRQFWYSLSFWSLLPGIYSFWYPQRMWVLAIDIIHPLQEISSSYFVVEGLIQDTYLGLHWNLSSLSS